jgi:hypothetical protein
MASGPIPNSPYIPWDKTHPPSPNMQALDNEGSIVEFQGNPNGVVSAAINQIGFDTVGLTFYVNTDGNMAWTSISGGGGGGGSKGTVQVAHPNGSLVGNPGDSCFATTDSTLWYKVTGTGTNSGWVQTS